jgi:sterol desaturase/sphingolipid hydroxylase (fatty acid hydroxylase superfamily)
MIFLWLLLSIPTMAFIEYAIHRWLMHGGMFNWTKLKFFTQLHIDHKDLHHGKYYKKFNDEPDPYGKELNIKIDILVNSIIMIAVLIPIVIFVSLGFAITLLTVMLIHHCIWNAIHSEMHMPQKTWVSRLSTYKWLARYHYLHHRYRSRNYQIVIPIFDYVFGTSVKPSLKDIEKMKELGLYA